jgi:hypothetical protein
MSGLMLYATAVYVRAPVRDRDPFTRGCCLVIGILGMLASNPLSLFVAIPDQASEVVMALYITAFRFFALAQLLPPAAATWLCWQLRSSLSAGPRSNG